VGKKLSKRHGRVLRLGQRGPKKLLEKTFSDRLISLGGGWTEGSGPQRGRIAANGGRGFSEGG